jgi:hypothetical protein
MSTYLLHLEVVVDTDTPSEARDIEEQFVNDMFPDEAVVAIQARPPREFEADDWNVDG